MYSLQYLFLFSCSNHYSVPNVSLIINECCFVYASEEELNSITTFHQSFVFLITLLASLVGLHFQVSGTSPLETHFTIILLLILAAVVYSIAYMNLFQTHNTENQTILRLTFLVSGAVICELLIALLVPPFWWVTMNLSISLIKEILHRWHQPIYKYLCHATNLVLKAGVIQHIYQYVSQMLDWLQQKLQSICDHRTMEPEGNVTEMENIV